MSARQHRLLTPTVEHTGVGILIWAIIESNTNSYLYQSLLELNVRLPVHPLHTNTAHATILYIIKVKGPDNIAVPVMFHSF